MDGGPARAALTADRYGRARAFSAGFFLIFRLLYFTTCWRTIARYQKGLPLGQLIVVSNRVAVPERSTGARAGGLEIAVNAALKERSGIWFGWSGRIATRGTIATQRTVQRDIAFITIDLSREDHQEYYRGFANRVLWPIFHYRIRVTLTKSLGQMISCGCMTIT